MKKKCQNHVTLNSSECLRKKVMIENLMSLCQEFQNYSLQTLPYLSGMKHHL